MERSVSECYAKNGGFHKPTGKTIRELVVCIKLEPPKNVKLAVRIQISGKILRRQDTPLKTNGTAILE
jgi:hypothetical protein